MEPFEPGGIKFKYEAVNFTLGADAEASVSDVSAPAARVSPGSKAFSSLHLLASKFSATVASGAAVAEGSPRRTGTTDAPRVHGDHVTSTVQEDGPAASVDDLFIDISTAEAAPAEYIPMEMPAEAAATPDARTSTPAQASTSYDVEAIGKRPYWMRTCSRIGSALLRLHQEIVELVELLHPAAEEIEARQAAVAQVAEVVRALWPSASVQVFGSFATGLYVPTSDIDLVVLNSNCGNIQTALKALANSLTRKGIAKGVQIIGKARVPIIKFDTVEYGSLAFDISFDVANGPQAAELVKEYVEYWPMMKPLILVLKLFLQQRELNEVYTGGIGSYALITMVAAFLQLHNSRRRATADGGGAGGAGSSGKKGGRSRGAAAAAAPASLLEPSLGVLLVDFFRLYGRVVNMPEVGISCADGGHYFLKEDKDGQDWSSFERPYLLSVEDPKDPTNDICKSSYNIMRVKGAFDFAYQQLVAPSRPSESLLARILRLGPILASRPRPTDLSSLYTTPHNPAPAQEQEQLAASGKQQCKRRSRSADGTAAAAGAQAAAAGAKKAKHEHSAIPQRGRATLPEASGSDMELDEDFGAGASRGRHGWTRDADEAGDDEDDEDVNDEGAYGGGSSRRRRKKEQASHKSHKHHRAEPPRAEQHYTPGLSTSHHHGRRNHHLQGGFAAGYSTPTNDQGFVTPAVNQGRHGSNQRHGQHGGSSGHSLHPGSGGGSTQHHSKHHKEHHHHHHHHHGKHHSSGKKANSHIRFD